MSKTTLVLGASLNENRFSNRCVKTLVSANIPVLAVGLREGLIDQIPVLKEIPESAEIDTVTLYLNPENQKVWYSILLNLKPARVIFNPGTENSGFEQMLESKGIEVVEDCTLMMVHGGRY